MPSLDDYVAPVFLTDTAKNLNDRFYLLLNNLVDSHPYSKVDSSGISLKDPSQTNAQFYNSTMAQMMQLQNDYFIYKNSIAKNSQDMLAFMNSVDDKINVIDAENKSLTKQINDMASSTHSAEGLLDDSQMTRNQVMVGNMLLLVIIGTGGLMYYKKVIQK